MNATVIVKFEENTSQVKIDRLFSRESYLLNFSSNFTKMVTIESKNSQIFPTAKEFFCTVC